MRRLTLSVDSTLRISLPPLLRNWEPKMRDGWSWGSERSRALSGAAGSAPSASVPSLITLHTVAMLRQQSGQSGLVET